jgi:hypothetical protein
MNPKHFMQVAPLPLASSRSREQQQAASTDDNAKTERLAASWMTQTQSLGRTLTARYNKLQVSHKGLYSIERLKTFETYCKNTSVAHAVTVCMATPIPALLAVVLLECIPVRDPKEGWQANYGFWTRLFLSGVIILSCSTYQISDMVTRIRFSFLQCLGVAILIMAMYTVVLVSIASVWVFPVPFGVVLGVGPCFTVYLVVLMLAIGPKTFKENPGLSRELKLQFYVLGAQGVVAMIYPAFSSIYQSASSNQRAGLVLLLPLTKLIMKNTVAWACSHLEDYVPVIAVFSIEVFNALYVATCMQSTNSTLATIVIITFDAVNGALTFYSLVKRTREIDKQVRLLSSDSPSSPSDELIPAAMTASQHLQSFRTPGGTIIRVRAPLKRELGVEIERMLDSLVDRCVSDENQEARERCPGSENNGTNSKTAHNAGKTQRGGLNPTEAAKVHKAQASSNPHEERELELVERTLQLLFSCEYHALVEYVECTVPIVFGVYSSILYQLPSRKYYPLTRDMAPGQLEGLMLNLSIYVGLEVISFVVMHLALKRKFKLSALYQLAFVLEMHVVQIQTRLLLWIVFVLQFTLQHYGVDFTFRFDWIH